MPNVRVFYYLLAASFCLSLFVSIVCRFTTVPRHQRKEFTISTVFLNLERYTSSTNRTSALSPRLSSVWTTENATSDRVVSQLRFARDYFRSSAVNRSTLTILLVHHSNYGDPPTDGDELFCDCPVHACSLTTDRRRFHRDGVDAIFFQKFTAADRREFSPKPPNQIWIVTGGEAPPLNDKMQILDTRIMGDLINWTAFYRPDSTIPTLYGVFALFNNYTGRIDDYAPVVDRVGSRRKKVAWMASNCGDWSTSGRLEYAEELGRYIEVDAFGACGKLKCPKSKHGECMSMLRHTYKFYLSFENSKCKGYITEKFHRNALQ